MSKKEAARMGGLARQKRYGDLGTPEGRRKGGMNSLLSHKKLGTRFKQLKIVNLPRPSSLLAELLGILAGDGHVDTYQATVTTNSLTDAEHAQHVSLTFKKLFGIQPRIIKRKNQNACVVVVSSKMVCDFLLNKGMVSGNKIVGNISMPGWVYGNLKFRSAYVRGLFDTDGSVYIDKHYIRGRIYKNIGIAFSNRAKGLLGGFKEYLETIGLHPTQKTNFEVFLRREKEIEKYFEVIGSSNPKHLQKVSIFFKQKRDIKKWRGVRVV